MRLYHVQCEFRPPFEDNFVMTKAEEGPEVTGVELKWLHWLLDQHWPYLKKAMEKVVKKELGFAVFKVIFDDFRP